MTVSAGSRLGPYEIVSPLGAGGMGEVYRARDTRLGRDVAIKVLPEHLSGNADLKQRFEREAKAISSLQHPHICTLYDVGSQDGVDFLVMECLEGENLAERLRRGALPVEQIFKIGGEIADGLDKAHRQGIVHRDLKPANIMLTKAGAKLMDFGLAKPAVIGASAASNSAPLLSAAMTQSSPSPHSPLTTAGTLVGTILYMSPEQLQGIEADARSDIFAFGAVLYEMATGKRAFEGKSQIKVASAILEDDPPPPSSVSSAVPPGLEHTIQTCLAKDPNERFQSAHDVLLQLRWAGHIPASKSAAAVGLGSTRVWAAIVVAAVLIAAGVGWFAHSGDRAVPMRVLIQPPDKFQFDQVGDFGGPPVLSPNGDKIAFCAHAPNSPRALWVRALNSFEAQKLEGTEEAFGPFWSPDEKSIGFFANGKLNRIPSSGGPVTVLADAPNARGGSWGPDDVIVMAPNFQGTLVRVGANGGSVTPATVLDAAKHTTHRWPDILPDGKHFLYLATNHNGGKREENGIHFASLDGRVDRLLVPSDASALYASGYLLFHTGNAIVAQPFDPSSGKLSGEALPVISRVQHDSSVWRSLFTVSHNGVLAYMPGKGENGTQLTWFDRTGKPIGKVGERSGGIIDPRLSPDGKRLAVSIDGEIWIYDLARDTRSRLTFNQGSALVSAPTWSSDGKTIAYTRLLAGSGGTSDIFTKPAGGGGEPTMIVGDPTRSHGQTDGWVLGSWSSDGKYFAYLESHAPFGDSIYARPLSGGAPILVAKPAGNTSNIIYYRISPDSHWVAYTSDESGRTEIYVSHFPQGQGKWQVSNNGGAYPAWTSGGRELFYTDLTERKLIASISEKQGELEIGTSQVLFNATESASGDGIEASADGKRFLVNTAGDEAPGPLHLVTNWTADLKK